MAELVPAIRVFWSARSLRRGCPGQARAWRCSLRRGTASPLSLPGLTRQSMRQLSSTDLYSASHHGCPGQARDMTPYLCAGMSAVSRWSELPSAATAF